MPYTEFLNNFFLIFQILDRPLTALSGGELQRTALAAVFCACAMEDKDDLSTPSVVIFDEPSSYLDVRQRVKMANVIRGLARENR